MTKQQKLHSKAARYLRDLETIIDNLKHAGSCKLDGDNAILNVKDQLRHLAQRCDA
ncbi:uncharacterized protein YukE [Nitrobacteraceae bacterium AZCC 2146]